MNRFFQNMILNDISDVIKLADYDTLFNKLSETYPSLQDFNCGDLTRDCDKKAALLKFLSQQSDETFPAVSFALEGLTMSMNNLFSQKSEKLFNDEIAKEKSKSSLLTIPDAELNNESRGLAIIFNMGVFMSSHELRNGSSKDVENLMKTFSESFNMNVEVYEDLTREGVKNMIKKLSQYDKLTSYDVFILVFMSHGHSDPLNAGSVNFITYEGASVNSEWIVSQFSENCCPQLSGKPKLFFFQSCRTSHENSACWIPPYSLVPLISQFQREDHMPLFPICRDTFIVYSTSVGHISFRNTVSGSHFISTLCDVLRDKSSQMDLFALMDEVNKRMQLDVNGPVIVIESRGMDRRLFFNNYKKKELNEKKVSLIPLVKSMS